MTLRAQLTPEEWSIVAQAPLLAGERVAAVERGGALRERFAIGEVYPAARELHGESALLDELAASKPSVHVDHAELPAACDQQLRQALAILHAKAAPDDVDAYKGFVLAVVQTAAEAHREGGFVGIGGAEVSAREQAALDEIAALLDA